MLNIPLKSIQTLPFLSHSIPLSDSAYLILYLGIVSLLFNLIQPYFFLISAAPTAR